MFLFFFTTLFSGGLIPTYLVVQDLGLLNTRWAMILPGGARGLERDHHPHLLPDHDPATSCSRRRSSTARATSASSRRVVLPLSGPIIAVNALFYAVGHWNAYFNALIYLTDRTSTRCSWCCARSWCRTRSTCA